GVSTAGGQSPPRTTAGTLPGAWVATGSPGLPALPYPLAIAPTAVAPAGLRSSSPTGRYSRHASTLVTAVTTRPAENTAVTSVRASVLNSNAGEATKNAARESTWVAAGPSTPVRPTT